MVGAALFLKDRQYAIMLLVQYCCYLRPSELLGVRGKQLIPPVKGAMTAAWAILLAPSYQAIPSKTQAFDESVLLDWEVFVKIHHVLLDISRADIDFAWHMPYTVFLRKFHLYAEVSGVHAVLKPHPLCDQAWRREHILSARSALPRADQGERAMESRQQCAPLRETCPLARSGEAHPRGRARLRPARGKHLVAFLLGRCALQLPPAQCLRSRATKSL